jgi:hypothetical protein
MRRSPDEVGLTDEEVITARQIAAKLECYVGMLCAKCADRDVVIVKHLDRYYTEYYCARCYKKTFGEHYNEW